MLQAQFAVHVARKQYLNALHSIEEMEAVEGAGSVDSAGAAGTAGACGGVYAPWQRGILLLHIGDMRGLEVLRGVAERIEAASEAFNEASAEDPASPLRGIRFFGPQGAEMAARSARALVRGYSAICAPEPDYAGACAAFEELYESCFSEPACVATEAPGDAPPGASDPSLGSSSGARAGAPDAPADSSANEARAGAESAASPARQAQPALRPGTEMVACVAGLNLATCLMHLGRLCPAHAPPAGSPLPPARSTHSTLAELCRLLPRQLYESSVKRVHEEVLFMLG